MLLCTPSLGQSLPGLKECPVVLVTKSCPTLRPPRTVKLTQLCLTATDCTVHGILQARILEWVAFPFSSLYPLQPRDRSEVYPWILYQLSHKVPLSMGFSRQEEEWVAISFSRGSSRPRDQTQVSCTAGRFYT